MSNRTIDQSPFQAIGENTVDTTWPFKDTWSFSKQSLIRKADSNSMNSFFLNGPLPGNSGVVSYRIENVSNLYEKTGITANYYLPFRTAKNLVASYYQTLDVNDTDDAGRIINTAKFAPGVEIKLVNIPTEAVDTNDMLDEVYTQMLILLFQSLMVKGPKVNQFDERLLATHLVANSFKDFRDILPDKSTTE